MRRTCAAAAVCLAIGLLAGCRRDDQIQNYQTPKETAPPPATAPAMPMMGADSLPVPANAAPPHWTTPAGWQEMPPNGVRLGDFVVPGTDGKKAEVTITTFPGEVGGALANVNRWRQEVGLGPIAENEIASDKVVVDSSEGKLYDLAGAAERTVVAMIPRGGSTWFYKMRGDPDVVSGAKQVFLQFLSSVHFAGNQPATTATDPHAGMSGMGAGMAGMSGMTGMGMGAPAAGASDAEPKWSVPANWVEGTPGPMVRKSFSIAGEAGQKAVVSISVLAGEGGGILANVNRWRGQLSLPAIAEDALPKNTASLEVPGARATMVDFSGTDAAGQPTRMVAVSVTRSDQTWFYKLTGAGAVVDREKDAFVKFVQSVSYP
jgi:hypothetical protein